jgi:ferredoxin-type protein NapH
MNSISVSFLNLLLLEANQMAKTTVLDNGRQLRQWGLLWLVIITISLGWKYPALGYAVPLVMAAGLVGSLFRGRWVCGNLCPRGGFLDRIMAKLSLNRRIPAFFRHPAFRWTMFTLLMGFMLYRGFRDPANPAHWGFVFWSVCAITTGVAFVLAVLFHPRTWCAFCPMGTMQSALGGHKGQLLIDGAACKGCKLCEKSCTFGLEIARYKDLGHLPHRDCLKCSECVKACPRNALSWPEKAVSRGRAKDFAGTVQEGRETVQA